MPFLPYNPMFLFPYDSWWRTQWVIGLAAAPRAQQAYLEIPSDGGESPVLFGCLSLDPLFLLNLTALHNPLPDRERYQRGALSAEGAVVAAGPGFA